VTRTHQIPPPNQSKYSSSRCPPVRLHTFRLNVKPHGTIVGGVSIFAASLYYIRRRLRRRNRDLKYLKDTLVTLPHGRQSLPFVLPDGLRLSGVGFQLPHHSCVDDEYGFITIMAPPPVYTGIQ
jgi:hypothetical protein